MGSHGYKPVVNSLVHYGDHRAPRLVKAEVFNLASRHPSDNQAARKELNLPH